MDSRALEGPCESGRPGSVSRVVSTVTPGLVWRGALILTGKKIDLRELNDLNENMYI